MIRKPLAGGLLRAAGAVAVAGAVAASLGSHGAGPRGDALPAAGVAGVPAFGPADPGGAPAFGHAAPRPDTVSYKEDVLPIFEKRCARCHGGKDEEGEVVAEVSLILINYERLMMGSEFGPVVTAGDPVDSWLLEMITEGDMPPEGEGDKVPEEEIAVIRQWIAEGAKNN